jgi:hypothetical protein
MALTMVAVSMRIGADFELSLQDHPSNREGHMLEAETLREQNPSEHWKRATTLDEANPLPALAICSRA